VTHPACAEILSALSDERASALSFVDLLQHEQGLLTENSIDQLQNLAEKKSAHAVSLNELNEVCRRLMGKVVAKPDNASIAAWLQANSKEGLAVWQEIRVLAEQARQINQINGELIQMKQRLNQQLLTALTRAVNQANVYGSDGQTNFSPGSGRSLGSV